MTDGIAHAMGKTKKTPLKLCKLFPRIFTIRRCERHRTPAGPLCSHANANYLEEPMHSIVTWKRLIPSRFPGRMLSRIFDGKHNWKRKAHCEAQWSSRNVCLYDIIGCYLWRKKASAGYRFLPLRTLLNCCYSSSCLGFYLRLFGCIFLGGKNHRSFSAVVGRITEVQTQTMMRKILEFSWFSNTCRLKLRKIQGDGESCTLYIYELLVFLVAIW